MMTIICPFEKDTIQIPDGEHKTIYSNYREGKYKQTHVRITNEEFWRLPKIFINKEGVISIVTGDQQRRGGYEYIKHCKSHECFIDRKNGVIVLKK